MYFFSEVTISQKLRKQINEDATANAFPGTDRVGAGSLRGIAKVWDCHVFSYTWLLIPLLPQWLPWPTGMETWAKWAPAHGKSFTPHFLMTSHLGNHHQMALPGTLICIAESLCTSACIVYLYKCRLFIKVIRSLLGTFQTWVEVLRPCEARLALSWLGL